MGNGSAHPDRRELSSEDLIDPNVRRGKASAPDQAVERSGSGSAKRKRAPDRASVSLAHPELVEAILAEAAGGLAAPVVERPDLLRSVGLFASDWISTVCRHHSYFFFSPMA